MTVLELRQVCQPSEKKKTDPLMEHTVLRPVSIYLTWLFVRLGLQADHVSFLGFMSAVAGGVCLSVGTPAYGMAGAVLVWTAFLLDCVDGEVSRYRARSSLKGTYLDYLVGSINDGLIFVGLGFYVAAVSGWDPRVVVGLSAVLALAEKMVGLTVHSVVFRYCRSYWDRTPLELEEDHDGKVWREMSLPQRLIRVPFETFFRVTLILVAMLASVATGIDAIMVAAWCVIVALSVVVTVVSFRNEFFGGRVEDTIEDFVKALKSRGDDSSRIS